MPVGQFARRLRLSGRSGRMRRGDPAAPAVLHAHNNHRGHSEPKSVAWQGQTEGGVRARPRGQGARSSRDGRARATAPILGRGGACPPGGTGHGHARIPPQVSPARTGAARHCTVATQEKTGAGVHAPDLACSVFSCFFFWHHGCPARTPRLSRHQAAACASVGV